MTNNEHPTYKSVMIHASAVEYRGKALVFLGPSETGKSTISQLLAATLDGARVYWCRKPYDLVLDAPEREYGVG